MKKLRQNGSNGQILLNTILNSDAAYNDYPNRNRISMYDLTISTHFSNPN